MKEKNQRQRLSLGSTVHDEDGEKLGIVRGFDQHGFYVSAEADVDVLSDEYAPESSQEGALMWRCWQCGEMGQLTDMPETCPACGAAKEEIYYWQED